MSTVSPEPLPSSFSSQRNFHRLRRLADGVLTLEPRLKSRAFIRGGVAFALLAGVAYPVCWLCGLAALPALGVSALFLVGGLGWAALIRLLQPLWTYAAFDRAQGTIALGGWRYQSRPTFRIGDVVAIQLCGPVAHEEWGSYQLNLALAPHDRLTLLDNGDRAALRQMGAELAAFLSVPFADHGRN